MIADLSGTGHDLILADVAKIDAVADGLASHQFDGLVNNAGIRCDRRIACQCRR
jgi:NAD(P)-dependent dehydrogenase (short-subunit alcohol dehydrogenase family)